MFKCHSTVLLANKYELADTDLTLEDEKHNHLNSKQK